MAKELFPGSIVSFKLDGEVHTGVIQRKENAGGSIGEALLLDGNLGPVRPDDVWRAGQEDLIRYRSIQNAADPRRRRMEIELKELEASAVELEALASSLEDEAEDAADGAREARAKAADLRSRM